MLCSGIFGCSVSTSSNFVKTVLDNAAPAPPPIAAAATVIRSDLKDSI
ncbi:hypothetical protein [Wolbachia pipientis]|nr:hypothetical protein [Wolbachia pipientis]